MDAGHAQISIDEDEKKKKKKKVGVCKSVCMCIILPVLFYIENMEHFSKEKQKNVWEKSQK